MKRLLRFAAWALLLLFAALLWNLAGLPDASGYISLRLPGWRLDTTLANLLLALFVLLLLLGVLRYLLRLMMDGIGLLRRRGIRRQRMSLLAAVFEGDWQQVSALIEEVAGESERSTEQRAAWAMLDAVQLLKTDNAEAAAAQLEQLEQTPALRPAARLLRAKALRQLGQNQEALALLQQLRPPPQSDHWLLMQLELIAELQQWSQLHQHLQDSGVDGLPAGRVAALRYRAWLHLIQTAQTPDQLIGHWEKLKPWPAADEADRLLEAAVGQLHRLQHPDRAAALLLRELSGEYKDKAIQLCHTMSPGAHCLPLLQQIRQMRRKNSNRRLRAAQAWLLLCCGDSATQGADRAQTPKKLLADWGQDPV